MQKADKEVRHFAFIDAARGIAFLAVLAVHTIGNLAWFPGAWLLSHGSYGVQLFFLISAVTLCYSASERRNEEKHPWVAFYIRRLFRIAPMFWLAMIFYWMVPGPAGDAQRYDFFGQLLTKGTYPQPWQFVSSIFFINAWNPHIFDSVVPGGWSISIEMTFYVCFPLLFLYINSLRRSLLVVLVCLVLSPFITRLEDMLYGATSSDLEHSMYYFCRGRWFFSSLPVFCVGICTYYVLRSKYVGALHESRFATGYLFIAGVVSLFELFRLQGAQIMLGIYGESMLVIIIMAALIVALSSPQLPLMVNPVIRYIGKVSFSCYLLHFFFLKETIYLLGFDLNVDRVRAGADISFGKGSMDFLGIYLVTLLVTVVASTLSFHLIERPGIAFGRRIIQKIEEASP